MPSHLLSTHLPPTYSGRPSCRAVPSGGGAAAPPVIVEKVPFLRAGALFLMSNHNHQQGALLNLGLPPQQFQAAYGHVLYE